MNRTKEKVKRGQVSAQEAYNNLYPLVGEKYARYLPTLKWLKNIIEGRVVSNKPTRQDKKEEFRRKNKKSLHKS